MCIISFILIKILKGTCYLKLTSESKFSKYNGANFDTFKTFDLANRNSENKLS